MGCQNPTSDTNEAAWVGTKHYQVLAYLLSKDFHNLDSSPSLRVRTPGRQRQTKVELKIFYLVKYTSHLVRDLMDPKEANTMGERDVTVVIKVGPGE